jgi:hypothetical protein
MGEDGVIAVVGASAGRRLFGCGVMYGLGTLLIYVTIAQPPALLFLVFMLALGVGVILLAERLRRVTRDQLVLYADRLVDSNGTVLAQMDEIVSVDRGAFAFKPSNGFTLKLDNKQPRSWAPGLWWRFGRFLGVGGAVSAGQAKFMAEQIALSLAQRSADTLTK